MIVKKILRNSIGATLLEGVITAGIIGINVLGFMHMQTTLSKEQTKQKAFDQISYSGRMIQQVMRNRAICTLTVRDNPIDQAFADLSNGVVDPNDLNNFIPINEDLIPKDLGQDVSISEYRIITDANNYYLEVTYAIAQPNNGKAIGFETIVRRHLLNTKIDPITNNFIECQSEEKNNIESVSQLACVSIMGEEFEMDPNTGACKPKAEDRTPDDPQSKDCGPGASYKLTKVGNTFELDCKPCVPQTKFAKWRCEKGKFSGVNWVNVCYYRTVGCEGSVDGLHQSDDDLFFMQGPTKAKGGDTGTRKNCKKKRRACPGENVNPEDAEEIAQESLMFVQKHYESIERKYREEYLVAKQTSKVEELKVIAELKILFEDLDFAMENINRALKAESSNGTIKDIKRKAENIKDSANKYKP